MRSSDSRAMEFASMKVRQQLREPLNTLVLPNQPILGASELANRGATVFSQVDIFTADGNIDPMLRPARNTTHTGGGDKLRRADSDRLFLVYNSVNVLCQYQY